MSNRIDPTKEQSWRLAEIYNRPRDWWGASAPATYREFRADCVYMIGGDGAIVAPGPAGMFLVIEPDGYCHT